MAHILHDHIPMQYKHSAPNLGVIRVYLPLLVHLGCSRTPESGCWNSRGKRLQQAPAEQDLTNSNDECPSPAHGGLPSNVARQLPTPSCVPPARGTPCQPPPTLMADVGRPATPSWSQRHGAPARRSLSARVRKLPSRAALACYCQPRRKHECG